MESKIKSFILNHPVKTSLLITFTIFTVGLLILNPAYYSNDDAYFSMFLSGFFSEKPLVDIILLHIGYCKLIAGLYTLAPSINWYFIVQLSLLYLSFSTILYCLLKLPYWFSLPLVTALAAVTLTNITFTTTALYLMAAGHLLIVHQLVNNTHKGSWVIGMLLILTGTLLRPVVIQAGIIIVTPLALILAYKRVIQLKSFFLVHMVGIVAFIGLQAIHHHYYKTHYGNPSGMDYFTHSEELINNPLTVTDEVLAEVGWHRNDLIMLDVWFAIDPTTFTADAVTYINNHATKKISLTTTVVTLGLGFLNNSGQYTLLLLFFIASMVIMPTKNGYSWLLAGIYLFMCIGLVLVARYRFYVFFPLGVFILLLQLVTKPGIQPVYKLKWVPMVLGSAWVIINLTGVINKPGSRDLNLQLAGYLPTNTYVLMTHGNVIFNDFFATNLWQSPAKYNGKNLIPTGCTSTMPVQEKLLEQHGITNLAIDLMTRDDLYISDQLDTAFNAYKQHMLQHHNLPVVIDSVGTNNGTPIFKVKLQR